MSKYQFSFNAASLRLNDFVQTARLKKDNQVVNHVNLFGTGKSTTDIRMIAEYEKRLATLTQEQLRLLTEGGLSTHNKIEKLYDVDVKDLLNSNK